jgi:hypothetical protein
VEHATFANGCFVSFTVLLLTTASVHVHGQGGKAWI